MNVATALTVLNGSDDKKALAKLSAGAKLFMAEGSTDDDSFDFVPTRISVASSGMKSFNTADGEPISPPLVGYAIEAVKVRAYWPQKDGNRMPFCSSVGGKFGTIADDIPDEDVRAAAFAKDPHRMLLELDREVDLSMVYECASCPLSEFGSAHQEGASGRGQACKQKIRVLFLIESWKYPVILAIPTMSVRPWNDFVSGLKQRTGLPYYAFKLEIGIQKKENKQGQPYGLLEFSSLGEIEDENIARAVLTTQKAMREYVRGRNVSDDYAEDNAEDNVVDVEGEGV